MLDQSQIDAPQFGGVKPATQSTGAVRRVATPCGTVPAPAAMANAMDMFLAPFRFQAAMMSAFLGDAQDSSILRHQAWRAAQERRA